MDHSYRVANGNLAEGPPSTMEYRASGNGNGNGYFSEPIPIEPVVAPIREDSPIRIYCFIEDLFFLAKIQETARKLGVKVGFVKGDKETVAKLTGGGEDQRPSLIVFDLNNANAKPLTLIPKIKAKLKRGTSVIGFLSHLQGDLKAKAIEAGCDMVMPRSAFSQNLPNLLRRHGLDAEVETLEA
jgi:CheY-like chemotaxis protein